VGQAPPYAASRESIGWKPMPLGVKNGRSDAFGGGGEGFGEGGDFWEVSRVAMPNRTAMGAVVALETHVKGRGAIGDYLVDIPVVHCG